MRTKKRLTKTLLLLGSVLFALTIVGATLRARPAIRPPENVSGPYQAKDFQTTLGHVNSQMAGAISREDLEVAPTAPNLTIARRISLALVGTGVSFEEIRALEAVPEDQQIHWWTSRLLEDPRYSYYFGERLARAYVGANQGPFLLFRRRKFTNWLADELAADTPYDKIVRSMISAEGLWTDRPEVNFVTATMDEQNDQRCDPIRLAGRTSRAFLGQRIDCLQCHDDFIDRLDFGTPEEPVAGMQEHFHQLAAFYSGTAAVNPFVGIAEDRRVYKYEFLGESKQRDVNPAVPFYPELLPKDGKPRQRLASWVTHPENRAFARATVNRVWALVFSRPLVEPVDDIPLNAEVPPVLDTLADDFVAHNYSLKRLIRLIIESQAFQRDSRAAFEVTPAHEQHWAAFPITQLRPEQVAGSLFQACSLNALDSTRSIFVQLKVVGDTQDFLRRFGDRGEDEFDGDAVTIPQRLIMMNGKMVAERTKVDLVANAATRIANMVPDDQQAVELTFLAVLNRRPSTSESQHFQEYVSGKQGEDRARAVSDIAWAMFNTTEFAWNH